MKDNEKSILIAKIAFGIPMFAVSMAVNVFLGGYTLMKLWGWFMVPTFGLPRLHLAAALGAILVAQYLTHQSNIQSEETKEGFFTLLCKSFAYDIFRPSLALLSGFIIKHWMN